MPCTRASDQQKDVFSLTRPEERHPSFFFLLDACLFVLNAAATTMVESNVQRVSGLFVLRLTSYYLYPSCLWLLSSASLCPPLPCSYSPGFHRNPRRSRAPRRRVQEGSGPAEGLGYRWALAQAKWAGYSKAWKNVSGCTPCCYRISCLVSREVSVIETVPSGTHRPRTQRSWTPHRKSE